MIRFLWRWVKRVLLLAVLAVLLSVAPIGYVELACQSDQTKADYAAILPPEHHRAETRSFMTYPEWHIVHAYEDYARVIEASDPHAYAYLPSIAGFWSSLCALSRVSGQHGAVDWPTKRMVYVIGASFTLELGAKAAYEETLGRITTWLRGPTRTALDDLSAQQARDYAQFLRQVPWYEWHWRADAAALAEGATEALRDRERRLALGAEYGVKAAYADLLVKAMDGMAPDALTLRMVLTGLTPDQLRVFDEVVLIDQVPEGLVVEAPRYRKLTHILLAMAEAGAQFIEIAGNDDILYTALSPAQEHEGALYSVARQGFDDHRHLISLPVSDLADDLRALSQAGLTLEHVHDY